MPGGPGPLRLVETTTVRLAALRPPEYHARKIEDPDRAAVAGSMRDFGVLQDLVVNMRRGREGVIVGGFQRWRLALEEGQVEISAKVVHLEEPEERRLNLLLNRSGRFDYGRLAAGFERSVLEGVGFSDGELAAFDRAAQELKPHPVAGLDEEEVPEPGARARSKAGRIYQLGRHRLLVGDCRDAVALRSAIEAAGGGDVELLVTDPPYNVDYGSISKRRARPNAKRQRSHITGDRQDPSDYARFLREVLAVADLVAAPGMPYYIWHADRFHAEVAEAVIAAGWSRPHGLVWVKPSLVLGRGDYHYQHEPCLYGWKPGARHAWLGGRRQSTVLEYPQPRSSDLHPTIKPVALFRRIVENSSRPGALVVDVFAGSGTTVFACEEAGRTAVVVEVDPGYADVIRQRWARHKAEEDWQTASPES